MSKVGKNHPKDLNVRVLTAEMEILRQYCEDTHHTQADVIHEFIRSQSMLPHHRTDPG